METECTFRNVYHVHTLPRADRQGLVLSLLHPLAQLRVPGVVSSVCSSEIFLAQPLQFLT